MNTIIFEVKTTRRIGTRDRRIGGITLFSLLRRQYTHTQTAAKNRNAMMSTADADIRSLCVDIATYFEAQATGSNPSNHDSHQIRLPSPTTLYHAGRVLYTCHSQAVADSFEAMLASLPRNYMHDVILHSLHLSYASLVVSFAMSISLSHSPAISALVERLGDSYIENSSSSKDILEGTESLCGLYLSSVNACQCCCLTNSSEEDTLELELAVISLAWVYGYLSNEKVRNDAHDEDILQIIILRTLSRMLVHGMVIRPGKSEVDMEEQLSCIVTVIQNIHSAVGGDDCILGDMLELEEDKLGEKSFISAICSKFGATNASQSPQLQYLLAMFKSFPKSSIPQSSIVGSTSIVQAERNAQSKPHEQSLTDIQIAHVKSVLPMLGDGYIEEALKCYSHNVERTVEALLRMSDGENNTTIHPRLQAIPENLPRKLRESVNQYSANVDLYRGAKVKDDGKEHAKIQKEHLKRVQQKAEEDALLLESVARMENASKTLEETDDLNCMHGATRDEYDDDYDDQYDGIGDDGGMAGGIGGLDEGLYDVDIHNIHQHHGSGRVKNEQDTWRKYNTLIKAEEDESRYWQDNQNLNRAEERGDGDATKYRGLDKGKGGRLMGPDGKYLPINRGGRKGRGSNTGGGTMSNAGRGEGGDKKQDERGGRGRGSTSKAGTDASSQGNKVDGELSKLQKRRKNDNKAKIGNHHRKDRATKKAAGIVPQG